MFLDVHSVYYDWTMKYNCQTIRSTITKHDDIKRLNIWRPTMVYWLALSLRFALVTSFLSYKNHFEAVNWPRLNVTINTKKKRWKHCSVAKLFQFCKKQSGPDSRSLSAKMTLDPITSPLELMMLIYLILLRTLPCWETLLSEALSVWSFWCFGSSNCAKIKLEWMFGKIDHI